MSKHQKLLEKILRGASDANIAFEERIRGSHHIFTRNGVAEILNLQPRGNKAKPYQVRQVRLVLLAHKLGGQTDA